MDTVLKKYNACRIGCGLEGVQLFGEKVRVHGNRSEEESKFIYLAGLFHLQQNAIRINREASGIDGLRDYQVALAPSCGSAKPVAATGVFACGVAGGICEKAVG